VENGSPAFVVPTLATGKSRKDGALGCTAALSSLILSREGTDPPNLRPANLSPR
jgi:hypothetical protein